MSDFLAGEPVSWERYQRHLRQEAELRGAAEQERDALRTQLAAAIEEKNEARQHNRRIVAGHARLTDALRGELEEAKRLLRAARGDRAWVPWHEIDAFLAAPEAGGNSRSTTEGDDDGQGREGDGARQHDVVERATQEPRLEVARR